VPQPRLRDGIGGTRATLRHGEPEQVVADLRDFYRGKRPVPPRPTPAACRGAAGRGDGGAHAGSSSRAARGRPMQTRRWCAVFSRGGACYDCHQVQAPPGGSLNFKIAPVAFPVRYMHKGWFDHKPHETGELQRTCHKAAACASSNNASAKSGDLLLPDLAELPHLPWRRDDQFEDGSVGLRDVPRFPYGWQALPRC
jgi:hypothetical protein